MPARGDITVPVTGTVGSVTDTVLHFCSAQPAVRAGGSSGSARSCRAASRPGAARRALQRHRTAACQMVSPEPLSSRLSRRAGLGRAGGPVGRMGGAGGWAGGAIFCQTRLPAVAGRPAQRVPVGPSGRAESVQGSAAPEPAAGGRALAAGGRTYAGRAVWRGGGGKAVGEAGVRGMLAVRFSCIHSRWERAWARPRHRAGLPASPSRRAPPRRGAPRLAQRAFHGR